MNLNREDVLRLKDELIKELLKFLSDEDIQSGEPIRITHVSQEFWFSDGKAEGEHTPDHGQQLSVENVEYLFRQADHIFEKQDTEEDRELKSQWVMKK